MQIDVSGNQIDLAEGASCADALKEGLSKKQFKKVVVAKCGEDLLDLATAVPATCTTLEPVFADSEEEIGRAHV